MHSASVNNNPGVAVFPAAQCTGVAMVAQERHLVSTPSILGARQHNPGISLGNLPVMYSCRLLFDRLVIRYVAI